MEPTSPSGGLMTPVGGRGRADGRKDRRQSAGEGRPSPLFYVCPYILGCELCERLAFYGIATNLVVYLQSVGLTSLQAAVMVPVFVGSCYLTPLIGGVLADSFWGRYKTILYSAITYLFGIVLLALSAGVKGLHPEEDEVINNEQATLLFFALGLIAVGTGGIKPNVGSFGADHFDETIEKEKKEKDSFFNWFYLSINVGSLAATTIIVYIEVNISWALGFLITAIAMALAIVVLVLGSPRYQHCPVADSPLMRVAKVVAAALTTKKRNVSELEYDVTVENFEDANVPLLPGPKHDQVANSGKPHWLDAAVGHRDRGLFTEDQVYEVKLVLGVLPVFFTTILYWTVYSQMSTFFVQQGTLMNLSAGFFTIPAASLAVFDVLAIIILIPIYDRIVVPFMERVWRRPTVLEKIGAGYLMAVVAMVVSFFIERERLHKFKDGEVIPREKQETHSDAQAVDMSVWWQFFQYLAIGLSEVWASIGQLEFFYDQAPDVMRSCMVALQLFSVALGSYAAGLLVWVINFFTRKTHGGEWIPPDLNQGRLDLMYLTIGGIMLADTLLFLYVAMKYEYKKVIHTPVRPPTVPVPIGHATQNKAGTGDYVSGSGASTSEDLATSAEGYESVEVYGRSVAYRPSTPATFPPELK